MTEIALFALSSAGVTITVAVAMFVMGRRAGDAEHRAGEEAVNAAVLSGKLAIATATADTWKAKANEETHRADALAALLEETASELDPAGARARLFARWTKLHMPASTTASGDPEAVQVPAEATTARSSDTDLERP